MIPVTKSFLPPIEKYTSFVQRAYDNQWLTNRGELVCELEMKISNYLNLDQSQILLTNNGTIPLQIALKLLAKGGEVITTPFSYVATTAAIVWEGCTPVFVDIQPEYLTIDETKIEEAITSKTTCILATHVFGNPCNVEEIDRIAKKHKLKVIYDAAHCYGVKYKGKSIFEYGDISTCSFHATKLFHTGEGGAIFCNEKQLMQEIFLSHNFGHVGPYEITQLGINGKMSEINAAMGLAVLEHIDTIIETRAAAIRFYTANLNEFWFRKFKIRELTTWNSSYYPVLLKDAEAMDELIQYLNSNDIFPRRYFYPILSSLPYIDNKCELEYPIASDTSIRILCLPLYAFMPEAILLKVVCSINTFFEAR